MKNNIKYFILLTFLMSMLIGCKKEYLDINTDPNNPSEVAPELVLPAAQASVAVIVGGQFFNMGSIWAQYFTQSNQASQYKREEDYTIKTDYLDRVWTEAYAGALNDLKNIRESNTGYNLVGAILQSYVYQMLVDIIDEIPYSEALKGLDGVYNPKFDKGEDVYDGIIADINVAIESYNNNPEPISKDADMMLNGNMDDWIRFGNSLKLRMYMRMSNTSKADPAQVSSLISEGMLISKDVKFTGFSDEKGKQNPWYGNEISSQLNNVNHMASETFLSYLTLTDDPRVSSVYKYNIGQNSYFGLLQGDYNNPDSDLAKKASRPNYDATEPVYLMTKYELSLLLAEAAVRYNTGDAQSLYERAIDENFALRGISGASNLYAAGEPSAYPAGASNDDQLEAIYMQKWVSMAMIQNYEAWTEIRRTGVPAYIDGKTTVPGNLLISVTSTLPPGQVLRRLYFPDVSVSRNPNTPSQPASLNQKIWWAN